MAGTLTAEVTASPFRAEITWSATVRYIDLGAG